MTSKNAGGPPVSSSQKSPRSSPRICDHYSNSQPNRDGKGPEALAGHSTDKRAWNNHGSGWGDRKRLRKSSETDDPRPSWSQSSSSPSLKKSFPIGRNEKCRGKGGQSHDGSAECSNNFGGDNDGPSNDIGHYGRSGRGRDYGDESGAWNSSNSKNRNCSTRGENFGDAQDTVGHYGKNGGRGLADGNGNGNSNGNGNGNNTSNGNNNGNVNNTRNGNSTGNGNGNGDDQCQSRGEGNENQKYSRSHGDRHTYYEECNDRKNCHDYNNAIQDENAGDGKRYYGSSNAHGPQRYRSERDRDEYDNTFYGARGSSIDCDSDGDGNSNSNSDKRRRDSSFKHYYGEEHGHKKSSYNFKNKRRENDDYHEQDERHYQVEKTNFPSPSSAGRKNYDISQNHVISFSHGSGYNKIRGEDQLAEHRDHDHDQKKRHQNDDYGDRDGGTRCLQQRVNSHMQWRLPQRKDDERKNENRGKKNDMMPPPFRSSTKETAILDYKNSNDLHEAELSASRIMMEIGKDLEGASGNSGKGLLGKDTSWGKKDIGQQGDANEKGWSKGGFESSNNKKDLGSNELTAASDTAEMNDSKPFSKGGKGCSIKKEGYDRSGENNSGDAWGSSSSVYHYTYHPGIPSTKDDIACGGWGGKATMGSGKKATSWRSLSLSLSQGGSKNSNRGGDPYHDHDMSSRSFSILKEAIVRHHYHSGSRQDHTSSFDKNGTDDSNQCNNQDRPWSSKNVGSDKSREKKLGWRVSPTKRREEYVEHTRNGNRSDESGIFQHNKEEEHTFHRSNICSSECNQHREDSISTKKSNNGWKTIASTKQQRSSWGSVTGGEGRRKHDHAASSTYGCGSHSHYSTNSDKGSGGQSSGGNSHTSPDTFDKDANTYYAKRRQQDQKCDGRLDSRGNLQRDGKQKNGEDHFSSPMGAGSYGRGAGWDNTITQKQQRPSRVSKYCDHGGVKKNMHHTNFVPSTEKKHDYSNSAVSSSIREERAGNYGPQLMSGSINSGGWGRTGGDGCALTVTREKNNERGMASKTWWEAGGKGGGWGNKKNASASSSRKVSGSGGKPSWGSLPSAQLSGGAITQVARGEWESNFTATTTNATTSCNPEQSRNARLDTSDKEREDTGKCHHTTPQAGTAWRSSSAARFYKKDYSKPPMTSLSKQTRDFQSSAKNSKNTQHDGGSIPEVTSLYTCECNMKRTSMQSTIGQNHHEKVSCINTTSAKWSMDRTSSRNNGSYEGGQYKEMDECSQSPSVEDVRKLNVNDMRASSSAIFTRPKKTDGISSQQKKGYTASGSSSNGNDSGIGSVGSSGSNWGRTQKRETNSGESCSSGSGGSSSWQGSGWSSQSSSQNKSSSGNKNGKHIGWGLVGSSTGDKNNKMWKSTSSFDEPSPFMDKPSFASSEVKNKQDQSVDCILHRDGIDASMDLKDDEGHDNDSYEKLYDDIAPKKIMHTGYGDHNMPASDRTTQSICSDVQKDSEPGQHESSSAKWSMVGKKDGRFATWKMTSPPNPRAPCTTVTGTDHGWSNIRNNSGSRIEKCVGWGENRNSSSGSRAGGSSSNGKMPTSWGTKSHSGGGSSMYQNRQPPISSWPSPLNKSINARKNQIVDLTLDDNDNNLVRPAHEQNVNMTSEEIALAEATNIMMKESALMVSDARPVLDSSIRIEQYHAHINRRKPPVPPRNLPTEYANRGGIKRRGVAAGHTSIAGWPTDSYKGNSERIKSLISRRSSSIGTPSSPLNAIRQQRQQQGKESCFAALDDYVIRQQQDDESNNQEDQEEYCFSPICEKETDRLEESIGFHSKAPKVQFAEDNPEVLEYDSIEDEVGCVTEKRCLKKEEEMRKTHSWVECYRSCSQCMEKSKVLICELCSICHCCAGTILCKHLSDIKKRKVVHRFDLGKLFEKRYQESLELAFGFATAKKKIVNLETDDDKVVYEDEHFQQDMRGAMGLLKYVPKFINIPYKSNSSLHGKAEQYVGKTLLFAACITGDRQKVLELLQMGANPRQKDIYKQRPIDIIRKAPSVLDYEEKRSLLKIFMDGQRLTEESTTVNSWYTVAIAIKEIKHLQVNDEAPDIQACAECYFCNILWASQLEPPTEVLEASSNLKFTKSNSYQFRFNGKLGSSYQNKVFEIRLMKGLPTGKNTTVAVFNEYGDAINELLQTCPEESLFEKNLMLSQKIHLQNGDLLITVRKLIYDRDYERKRKKRLKTDMLELIKNIKEYNKKTRDDPIKLNGFNFDSRSQVDLAMASIFLDDVGLINYLVQLRANFTNYIMKKAKELEYQYKTPISKKIREVIVQKTR